jgi:hypothetical protein
VALTSAGRKSRRSSINSAAAPLATAAAMLVPDNWMIALDPVPVT